jgi:VanZ family protein
MHLRALPLAIGLIVFATAVPVELRAATRPTLEFGVFDVVGNLLLYVPLGLALAHRRPLIALGLGLLLSASIETIQVWFVGRYAGLFDILANTCGVAVGFWLVLQLRGYPSDRLGVPVGRGLSLIGLTGILMLSPLWLGPSARTDFANWAADFQLLAGNEVTGDRPWKGRIDVLGVFAGSTTRQEAKRLSIAGDAELAAALRATTSGYVTDSPLVFNGSSAHHFAAGVASGLYSNARKTGQLTVVVRAAADSTLQDGFPRLVSFSKNTTARNFDVLQQGARLWFRIRTPVSGTNGMDWDLPVKTSPVLVDGQPLTIVATYDGAVARVFADGRLVGRSNFSAAGCAMPTLCDSDLPLTAALFGGCAAVVPMGFWRIRRSRRTRTIVLACAFITAVFVGRTDALPPDLATLAAISTVGGAAVVAIALVGKERHPYRASLAEALVV